jgi:hypothetical protein
MSEMELFINAAVGALPEAYKNHPLTRVMLAAQGIMVCANPEMPPTMYKEPEKVWGEITWQDRQDHQIGPLL